MTLHENKELFADAIRFTSQQMNIRPEYIEKDYWVTYALYQIFNDPIGRETVFKGGTALSKCYKRIDRFSEDIDLVMLRHQGESNNAMTTKIRKIGQIVNNVLPEVPIDGLTIKMGMNRKTAHAYPKIFTGNYGQVRDIIVVEATWLGYFEPFTEKELCSFVGEMMINNAQEDIAKSYGVLPFKVQVLEPVRTICEKIMSMVRFSYGNDAIGDLKKKIRHVYDLNQLLKDGELSQYLDSEEFFIMLLKVAQDDVVSFRNNNAWLEHHPSSAMLFRDLENLWPELENTYNNDFKGLVHGVFPAADELLSTLRRISIRLQALEWSIKIEKAEKE